MIDLHSHLVPGVDDGASDLAQAREALEAMQQEGVRTLVTTPHFRASAIRGPEAAEVRAKFDAAFAELRRLARSEFPGVRVERGVELMMDAPDPDLSDDWLRLAGTRFVLVEFPSMMIPPHSVRALYDLGQKGWAPIIAHPERYADLRRMEIVEEWRSAGALLQVNSGSLVGRFGSRARTVAWELLQQGWVDYLSSDYHGRGRLSIQESRSALLEGGGEEQVTLLTERNPERLLSDELPLPVPPFRRKLPFWRRLLPSLW